MPDIDPRKIRAGDAVRVRMHTPSMQEEGIDPIEFESKVYAPGHPDYSALCIAGFGLAHPDLTVLEHIPARPDWADALVGRFGECLYGRSGKTWTEIGGHGRKYEESEFHRLIAAAANDPITVVIDADGNPPAPEWLDAYALDELPIRSIVLPKGRSPRVRRTVGLWVLIPEATGGMDSAAIAPARVLWTPEAGR